MQADEQPISLTESTTLAAESETTSFMDVAPGTTAGHVAVENEFDVADAVVSAGLQDFLKRPVRIASFSWNQSDAGVS